MTQQEALFYFLDTWDGTKAGMVVAYRHKQALRDTLRTVNAFQEALRGDVDDAVLAQRWLRCKLKEGGIVYGAYFRPVLEVTWRIPWPLGQGALKV